MADCNEQCHLPLAMNTSSDIHLYKHRYFQVHTTDRARGAHHRRCDNPDNSVEVVIMNIEADKNKKAPDPQPSPLKSALIYVSFI